MNEKYQKVLETAKLIADSDNGFFVGIAEMAKTFLATYELLEEARNAIAHALVAEPTVCALAEEDCESYQWLAKYNELVGRGE